MPEKGSVMPAENPKPETRTPGRQPRKSGVVVPHSSKWHQQLGAWALWAVYCLVSATLRYRLHDPHGFMTRPEIRQVLFCTWHNR
ncbi:MAG: hypothetical protein WAO02_14910, partial [Verrucomicrobiia bacterium]